MMTQRDDSEKRELKPITVRVRPEDYELLKEYAESRQASLNTVVSEAIAQYGAKIQRKRAMERITDLRRRIYESYGVGTDSAELLRELREERTEQIVSASEPPAGKPRGGARS